MVHTQVFNQLGSQLGLPTTKVESHEVFSFDPELLAMIPFIYNIIYSQKSAHWYIYYIKQLQC